jgi:hypothetical protein
MKLRPLGCFLLALTSSLALLHDAVAAPAAGQRVPPIWTATASLFTLQRGHWTRSTRAEVLEPLRGILVVRDLSSQRKPISALMQIRHITWVYECLASEQ